MFVIVFGAGLLLGATFGEAFNASPSYNVRIVTSYRNECAYSYERVGSSCIKIFPSERLICGNYEIVPLNVRGNEMEGCRDK